MRKLILTLYAILIVSVVVVLLVLIFERPAHGAETNAPKTTRVYSNYLHHRFPVDVPVNETRRYRPPPVESLRLTNATVLSNSTFKGMPVAVISNYDGKIRMVPLPRR